MSFCYIVENKIVPGPEYCTELTMLTKIPDTPVSSHMFWVIVKKFSDFFVTRNVPQKLNSCLPITYAVLTVLPLYAGFQKHIDDRYMIYQSIERQTRMQSAWQTEKINGKNIKPWKIQIKITGELISNGLWILNVIYTYESIRLSQDILNLLILAQVNEPQTRLEKI